MVSRYEGENNNLIFHIEETPHTGRALNSEMERSIIGWLTEENTPTDASVEFYVKRTGDPDFSPRSQNDQEQEGPEEAKAKDPYYQRTEKREYTLEEAGPEPGKPAIFVLSNPPDGRNTAWKHEHDVAEEIAKRTNKPLSKVTLYVEQGNKEYLHRTFRNYTVSPAHGSEERLTTQANNRDREGRNIKRDEIDSALARAQGYVHEQTNTQEIDLSRHAMDIRHER
jgi:hypothetical protein